MPKPERSRPAWVGFLIGLLAVVLPLGGYLLVHRLHEGFPERESRVPTPDRAVEAPEFAEPLRPSGESLPDPEPAPDASAIRLSLGRAERWLRTFQIDPFGAPGTDSLRIFALEVECWHRLGESCRILDPPHRDAIEMEVRSRLRRFGDAGRIADLLRAQGTTQGSLEILLLAGRCRDHGVDTAPVLSLIRSMSASIGESMDRLPASTAALYAAALADLGIDLGRPVSRYQSIGIIAARPPEIDLGIARIYGVTQEIFARTSSGDRPLVFADPMEQAWLDRVLPYLEMACTMIRNQEAAGDLLTCMNAAGLDRTYGYREGLRALISRQNPDGSYGDATGAGRARIVSLLPATTSAITALSLEARRAAGSEG